MINYIVLLIMIIGNSISGTIQQEVFYSLWARMNSLRGLSGEQPWETIRQSLWLFVNFIVYVRTAEDIENEYW
jgi:hypothetical protein